jgi:glycosyltransferase involved in cell wall biosynthesis
MDKIKVVTSCLSRFWIYDQAFQLYRTGLLFMLIQAYPKKYTRNWQIPDVKVKTLLANGILMRITNSLPLFLQSNLTRFSHESFGRRLSRSIPKDTDVFIGLSSYSLEAIKYLKPSGIITIVDHGSLHLECENELMQAELKKLGLKSRDRTAPKWIVDRENCEFKLADWVMVLSEKAKHTLILKGVPAEKVFVNSCGVDISKFKPLKNTQKNIFKVIFCGSITPRKGLHYLMQAFSELNLNNSELLIIGNISDREYFEKIKIYISEKVKFLGTYPQSDLPKVYADGAIFVLPSIADGFGMVVTQALACGLPVIVTDNVGAKDIVIEGVNGYVVPTADIGSLKEKIMKLYMDRDLLLKMSTAAKQISRKSMTWNSYGDRLKEFLTKQVCDKN